MQNFPWKEAVMLVAGKGERLQPLTQELPKPLTEVNGVSILENTLEHLSELEVEKVYLVTGHLHDKLMAFARQHNYGMEIAEIFNSDFEQTNNMYSLWLAQDILQRGCLLLEGDVFFEKRVLASLAKADRNQNYWLADRFTAAHDGCLLKTDSNGIVQQLHIIRGERLGDYKNCYKSVGILSLSADLGHKLGHWLKNNIDQGRVDVYYDLIFADHLEEANLTVLDIHGARWYEIDDSDDLEQAEMMFKEP